MTITLTTPLNKTYEKGRISQVIFNRDRVEVVIVYHICQWVSGAWQDMDRREANTSSTEYNNYMSQMGDSAQTMQQLIFKKAEAYLINKGLITGTIDP